MSQFPSIEGLAKSDVSGKVILGSSMGTNDILLYLREHANRKDRRDWNVLVINVYTLFRNVYTNGMSIDNIIDGIKNDINILSIYYEAYAHTYNNEPALILFYVPDYTRIPEVFLRVHTGQQLEFDTIWKTLRKKIISGTTGNTTRLPDLPNVRRFMFYTKEIFPHKELGTFINSTTVNYGNHKNGILLLSHCTIDLHLLRYVRTSVTLIESFTGSIKDPPDFGTKLIKEVPIPLSSATHRIFGDLLHLKPLASGRGRTKLIELADKRKWMIRTNDEIIRDAHSIFPDITEELINVLRL